MARTLVVPESSARTYFMGSLFRKERFQFGQLVGVDQVHAGVEEFLPEGFLLRGRPEPDESALRVSLLDERLELRLLIGRHRPVAEPLELRRPTRTDPGDLMGRGVGVEVLRTAVDADVPHRLLRDRFLRPVAGEDDRDRLSLELAVLRD